jgi:glycosyltransferase involved in cell wall biosynthesis
MKMNEQKILIIITLFSIGGATETVVSLATGLKKRGYNVDIVTGRALKDEGDMFTEAEKLGLNVIIVEELVRDINLLNDFKALLKLLKIIKNGKYSIIHTHSSKAGVLGRFAAWIANAPVILHTIHGLPYHNYQARALTKSYILIEKICAMISSKIISVTYAIVRNCVSNGISTQEKFVVIRSGLELENYKVNLNCRKEMREKYGFNKQDIVAAVISRIAPLKGHEYIIELAKKTKINDLRIKYFLIGDGESGLAIRSMIKENSLENSVKCCGMVSPDEIPNMISAADFIIHPSLREGLARVLFQSIIMNKKVITFDLDGVDEVIVDGISGYSIETGNSDDLYNACISICKDDSYKNISESFKQKIEQEFSNDTMVERHIDLYTKLLHK